MIVLRICTCGRSHDVAAWSLLELVGRSVHDGDEWRSRRCVCGEVLEVRMHEDDVAEELVAMRRAMHGFYSHARLCLAGMLLCRPEQREARLMQARGHRIAARDARDRAHLLEDVLRSIFRSREIRSRMQRVGRNIQVVEGGRASSRKVAP